MSCLTTFKRDVGSTWTERIFTGQSLRSPCSSFCLPPAPHWWVRWGWTGLQHWWSHGSPLCWPPSYGSLEKRKTQGSVIQRTQMNWGWVSGHTDWAPVPVRTSLKAVSTLVESSADVSINMRPLFSGLVRRQGRQRSQWTNTDIFKEQNNDNTVDVFFF